MLKRGVRLCSFAVLLSILVLLPFWMIGYSSTTELFHAKMKGNLAHVSWPSLLRLSVPVGMPLPGRLAHLRLVHKESEGSGTCGVQWQTPYGPFWARADDGWLLRQEMSEQYIQRVYEREPIVVRTGDIVLDAGANLGMFTRWALMRGARQVVAFEPEPTNIACFKRTFEAELKSGRVVLMEAALWESSGVLNFAEPAPGNSGGGSAAHGGSNGTVSVPAITLDETVDRLRLSRVDFIKMDIEGAERRALSGAGNLLLKFRPRMAISTEHGAGEETAILNVVLAANPSYRHMRGDTVLLFY